MKKKYNSETKETPKQKFLQEFTDALIQRMEEIKASGDKWKKGWMSVGMKSARSVDDYFYTGDNRLYLNFVASMNHKTNVWGTFNALTSLKGENNEKVMINKGEHARTILKPYEMFIMHKEERENNPDKKTFISASEYAKLSEEEKQLYKKTIEFQSIKVFNVDQTNLKEVNPALYQKFDDTKELNVDLTNAYKFKPLDELMEKQTWLCPIRQEAQDSAFFRPSTPEIVVPTKEQFDSQPEFYSTLLHEMAHSTSIETKRSINGFFGSPEYAKEELVAELSAAFTGSTLGITTTIEQDNSAHYLESWLSKLKQDPEFLRDILEDVDKATKVIEDRLQPYMQKQEITISAEEKVTDIDIAVAQAFSAISQFNEVADGIKPISQVKDNEIKVSDDLNEMQKEMLKHYVDVMGGKYVPAQQDNDNKLDVITFDKTSLFSADICANIIKGASKEEIINQLTEKSKQHQSKSEEVVIKEKHAQNKKKGLGI